MVQLSVNLDTVWLVQKIVWLSPFDKIVGMKLPLSVLTNLKPCCACVKTPLRM